MVFSFQTDSTQGIIGQGAASVRPGMPAVQSTETGIEGCSPIVTGLRRCPLPHCGLPKESVEADTNMWRPSLRGSHPHERTRSIH
jgi:hypothetical protein